MTPRRIALALVVLVACGPAVASKKREPTPFAPASTAAAPDPSKMGPYPVGVVTYESIVDDSRVDLYGSPRRLYTEVWYPATEAARGKPGKSYDVMDLMTNQEKQQVKDSGIAIPILHTAAVENADPRLDDAPYPVVIFSHGQFGVRWQTTFFTVALASHGYIVVSPDHPGNTLRDELSLKQSDTGGIVGGILLHYLDRGYDIDYLINYFTTLDGRDFLAGMPDGDHVGVSGHSFGALTSFRAAAFNPKVKAIVPMAPTDMGLALPDVAEFGPNYRLNVPTLIEGSGDDHTLAYADNAVPAYDKLGTPRGLVDILHGGHFTFSDLCKFDLANVAEKIQFIGVDNVLNDGCGPTNPTADIAEPIVNNYAIGFFNWQLRGSTGSLQYLTQARADALTPGVATFESVLK